MFNKSARFTLLASLCASRAVASVPPPESYPVPSRCRGSLVNRVNRDSGVLSSAERKQAARDLLAYRITRDLTAPRNPYALALVA